MANPGCHMQLELHTAFGSLNTILACCHMPEGRDLQQLPLRHATANWYSVPRSTK